MAADLEAAGLGLGEVPREAALARWRGRAPAEGVGLELAVEEVEDLALR